MERAFQRTRPTLGIALLAMIVAVAMVVPQAVADTGDPVLVGSVGFYFVSPVPALRQSALDTSTVSQDKTVPVAAGDSVRENEILVEFE